MDTEHLTRQDWQGLLALLWVAGILLAIAVKSAKSPGRGFTKREWRFIILWPLLLLEALLDRLFR